MLKIRTTLLAGLCAGAFAAPAFAAPVIYQAAGPNPSDIQSAIDDFNAALGDLNPPGTPPQPAGRRQIGWDGGTPAPGETAGSNAISDPFFMPFGNFRGFGAVFSTPGRGFKMSADPATTTLAAANYGDIDPSYEHAFAPFSPPRLFTSIDSNIIDVRFVIPGSDEDAGTNGFGVVFSNVNIAGSTQIEFFDPDGGSLGAWPVPAWAGNQTFSFLGVYFDAGEQVARARITQGTDALAPGVIDGGGVDVVVTDDFIFGEPQPQQQGRVFSDRFEH